MEKPKKEKIKIIVESWKDGKCAPCEDLKKEAERLNEKYKDTLEIELVECVVDPANPEESKKMQAYFGKEGATTAPIAIIESGCKSEKMIGYSEGQLEQKINEVRCNAKKGETEKL